MITPVRVWLCAVMRVGICRGIRFVVFVVVIESHYLVMVVLSCRLISGYLVSSAGPVGTRPGHHDHPV